MRLFFWLCVFAISCVSCRRSDRNTVVVYTSQDQHFAEPILADFGKRTGIKVRAVYDSEAVKTVALANRLLAEKSHPRCDVWWSNEALRTRQLAARGVFDTNLIAEFGFRSRRMVVNTNLLSLAAAPKSLVELTNERWRGQVALAYPMFGTTSAQFIALRRHWGGAHWENWCHALAANAPFLVDGNSVVVKFVGRGDALIGLTDFDDVVVGQREGLPIAALPASEETLLIPNSVAVVQGAPHATEAQQLYDFLRSEPVRATLVAAFALEGAESEGQVHLPIDWSAAHADLDVATEKLKAIFLR